VHRKIQRKENKKPQMGNRAPITVFIPVYNEEAILKANIETLARYLETHWPDYEILIASNGSTDRTVAISKELHESNLRVNFFHLSAKGVGLAFEEGIRKAAWDRIITVDADLTTDMNFIPRAARLLDEYEIVVGSKKNGSQKRSLVRLAGSGSFIFCVRLLLKLPYVDYSIGSKAYRRSTIARYTRHINYGSSYVIEIIYRAWRHGSRITEIPVYCEDTRESKFNLAHEGIYRFSNLFKLWLTR
jgi:glycosyltransferase involved in cell wall biosynthesis